MGLLQNVISLVELVRTPTPELNQRLRAVPPRPRVMSLAVDSQRCSGCGSCTEICPVDAIEMRQDTAVVDQDTCAMCGACLSVCPDDALALLEE